MSEADYGERGEVLALRAIPAIHPVTNRPHLFDQSSFSVNVNNQKLPKNSRFPHPANPVGEPTPPSSYKSPAPIADSNARDKLDFPNSEALARNELLRDAVFPDWKDDTGGDELGSPEELQKKDPLGTQIWKLYSKTKTRLPNQERMENLTWRMMAMNLKRREQMQAQYVQTLQFASKPSIIDHLVGVSKTRQHP